MNKKPSQKTKIETGPRPAPKLKSITGFKKEEQTGKEKTVKEDLQIIFVPPVYRARKHDFF